MCEPIEGEKSAIWKKIQMFRRRYEYGFDDDVYTVVEQRHIVQLTRAKSNNNMYLIIFLHISL